LYYLAVPNLWCTFNADSFSFARLFRGITSVLRTLAATTGPTLTGFLAGSDQFWIAFVAAGALRLAYDIGLFVMFINIKLHKYEAVPTSPVETVEMTDAGERSSSDEESR